MNHQLLKFLYSRVEKSMFKGIEKDSESFERADKIVIWIVGFSIGIFILLFKNDLKTSNVFDLELTKPILLVALAVVILGLLFRIFSFFTQMLLSQIVIGFVSYADSFANTPELPLPSEINNNHTIDDISFFLKSDFGIELPPHKFNNTTEESKMEYRELLLNYHSTLSESNNMETQMTEYITQFANHFGISKKKFENNLSNNRKVVFRGKFYQFMLICSYILFFLTIGTFILGTGIIFFILY